MGEAKECYNTPDGITRAMERNDYNVEFSTLVPALIEKFPDEVAIISAICKAASIDENSVFSLHSLGNRYHREIKKQVKSRWC